MHWIMCLGLLVASVPAKPVGPSAKMITTVSYFIVLEIRFLKGRMLKMKKRKY